MVNSKLLEMLFRMEIIKRTNKTIWIFRIFLWYVLMQKALIIKSDYKQYQHLIQNKNNPEKFLRVNRLCNAIRQIDWWKIKQIKQYEKETRGFVFTVSHFRSRVWVRLCIRIRIILTMQKVWYKRSVLRSTPQILMFIVDSNTYFPLILIKTKTQ